jgi:hypothetical protein
MHLDSLSPTTSFIPGCHRGYVSSVSDRNWLHTLVWNDADYISPTRSAGPNWIHGTNNNPILEIAQKTSTATGSWTAKTSVIDDTGKLLPLPDAKVYSDMMWDIIGTAFAHSNKNCSTISPEESLLDFFNEELTKRIPESPGYEQKRKIMYQIAESWGAYVGNHSK